MSERLDERLRRAARTYRRLGNHTAEGMSLEAADTICELQTENAKLRELVKALLQCHVEDTATCAKCSCRSPLHGGCMADVNADELGVEVDDG